MKLINRLICWTGWALVPRHSVKSLIEWGNALGVNRPDGPAGQSWLHDVARIMPETSADRHSWTVEYFLRPTTAPGQKRRSVKGRRS